MNIRFKLFSHQKRIIASQEAILYARMGRGSGKSFTASILAVLAMLRGEKVICLGQTASAVAEVLAPEILDKLNKIIPGKYSYNKSSHKFQYRNGIIYLQSYESIESIRGYTMISLAILDEAALAPPDVFTILAFCMRGEGIHPRIRMLSTPRSDNWLTRYIAENKIPVIHATTRDNKLISEEQIEIMKRTCVDENAWRREFFGEEVDDDNGGSIFTSDLFDINIGYQIGGPVLGYCIGIDCSGLGTDSNIILVRSDNEILEIIDKKVATAAELASIIRGIVFTRGRGLLSHICIDEAYGLDLANRLEEMDLPVTLVPFGGAPENKAYANKRAELYFNLKKGIQEHGLKGITEEIRRELQATKYKLNNSNRLQLIPKDEIKLNLGRSPDYADALALSFNEPIIPREAIESMNRAVQEAMEE
ncbi:MAG: phage terminase large subunit [Clostridiales bacterium]|nr:phage terminase large subunit [Clostridiales bacterium]